MEHREDGLLVDVSGQAYQQTNERPPFNVRSVINDTKQEKELETLSQETRLMRAMNEIREYQPKTMKPEQRDLFNAMCEKIFAKHGITAVDYRNQFGHLGTPQNLKR